MNDQSSQSLSNVQCPLSIDPPLPILPPRNVDANKGDYGTALVVGGSRGMSGAISLSGMAALRGGAGRVRLAVAESSLDVVAGHEPSYMTAALPEDAAGHIAGAAYEGIVKLAASSTAMALGPGLGRSPELDNLVVRLYRELPLPMIVDADALNALSTQPAALASPAGPRILTPHPGEFQRLTGKTFADRAAYEDEAVDLARRSGVVIVLKGHHTLITDGEQQARNTTGNPGMATGGTGDVLTGLITALVCQHLSPFAAAQLGVHLHGLAGDLAAMDLGQVSLIASDLIRFLPAAFLSKRRLI